MDVVKKRKLYFTSRNSNTGSSAIVTGLDFMVKGDRGEIKLQPFDHNYRTEMRPAI
jgi:hypothetical protein